MTPAELLLLVASVGFGGTFVALAAVTMGVSVRGRRRDRRRVKGRESVRRELLEYAYSEDREWESWLKTLSGRERAQLEPVLERYLRTVSGRDRERFLELASVIELGRRADEALDTTDVPRRLQALSTLAVVEHPVEIERLVETCSDNRRTREGVARLLYERRHEYDAPAAAGTELMLAEGTEPLTIYGMETLFDLNRGRETPLLALASERAGEWNPAVLVQVCRVLEFCQITAADASFEWLLALFEHETPAVRASAVRVLKGQGWRRSLREELPYRTLIGDDDPEVRQAVYETLAYWGDADARQLLEWAVVDESDPRCQLVAIRGLVSMGADPAVEHRGWPVTAWRWIEAEFAVDSSKRLAGMPRGPE